MKHVFPMFLIPPGIREERVVVAVDSDDDEEPKRLLLLLLLLLPYPDCKEEESE